MSDYFTTSTKRHRLAGAFQPLVATGELKAQALTLINQHVPDHLRLQARATVRRMHSRDQVERFIERFRPVAQPGSTQPSDHTYNTEYNLPHTD